MAIPTSPTRLSPAELRRRLLSPPTDSTTVPAIPDEPAPVARRRDPNRVNTNSQASIDLDALMHETSSTANPRLTPLPESRLDSTLFRKEQAAATVVPVNEEVSHLRIQNAELSRIIEEMRPLIEEATAVESATQGKEKRFHDVIAERDLQLEEMELKLSEAEERLTAMPAPKQAKNRDELEEWNDELEQEAAKLQQMRRTMDDDRKQLRDDEDSLERQMREMECSMARERAMMARQETELKRLSAEIQHELELLQRGDGTLREQLSKFQRRHQEVFSRTPGTGPTPGSTSMAVAEPLPPTAIPVKKDSGLFGRIFRGNK